MSAYITFSLWPQEFEDKWKQEYNHCVEKKIVQNNR